MPNIHAACRHRTPALHRHGAYALPFNNATVAIRAQSRCAGIRGGGTPSPGRLLLIAVAAGASLDFLTPFGRHNDTLAMGAGGSRVSDFLRAGSPLAFASYFLTVLLVALIWL